MGKPLSIHGDMTLNPRNLFPGVIPLMLCRVRVLDTLRINDAKRGLLVATRVYTGRANLIFLMPAQASWSLLPQEVRSIAGSIRAPCATSENHAGSSATDIRF